jgi:hypothetical protein
MAGVRIYDVSNPRAPRLVKNVQTCKGSHTHTLIPHPTDKNVIYATCRAAGRASGYGAAGCKNGTNPRRRKRTRCSGST